MTRSWCWQNGKEIGSQASAVIPASRAGARAQGGPGVLPGGRHWDLTAVPRASRCANPLLQVKKSRPRGRGRSLPRLQRSERERDSNPGRRGPGSHMPRRTGGRVRGAGALRSPVRRPSAQASRHPRGALQTGARRVRPLRGLPRGRPGRPAGQPGYCHLTSRHCPHLCCSSLARAHLPSAAGSLQYGDHWGDTLGTPAFQKLWPRRDIPCATVSGKAAAKLPKPRMPARPGLS